MKISIIIKAYNEEANIAKSVESSLEAVKEFGGEVIVVDSLSEDNTVEIVKKYPVKIVQINKNSIKTSAAALEVGYRASRGEFILALDGDMILDKNFIKKALPKFIDQNVAAIGGLIHEPYAGNILSKRAQRYYKRINTGEVDYLDGGGLYRRSAIQKIGYLSNPYLFSAEESELGFELVKRNYKLLRLRIPFAVHYFYREPTTNILLKKWKAGYMYGFGQVLRLSIKSGYSVKYLLKLRIYITTLIWYFLLLIALFSLYFTKTIFLYYVTATSILLILLLIRKKNFKDLLFSLFSWTIRTLGIIRGFLIQQKTAGDYNLRFKVIKG